MARNDSIDFVKGIAIILMVVVHAVAGCALGSYISRFATLFHMPVFFMVAGWLYRQSNEECVEGVADFLKKKIRRLWFPFVLWCGLFVVFHDVFFSLNIYSNDPTVEMGGLAAAGYCEPWGWGIVIKKLMLVPLMQECDKGLAGAFWFLRAMFISSGLYCCLGFAIRKLRFPYWVAQTIVALGLILWSKYWMTESASQIVRWIGGPVVLTAYALMHLGALLRHFDLAVERLGRRWMFVVACVCSVVLLELMRRGNVYLVNNRYPSILFLVLSSLCGWYLLMSISQVEWFGRIGAVYVGRHTMPLLIFHFLAFKLVTAVGVLVAGEPLSRIGAFPVLNYGFWWGLAYAFFGVGIPLVINAAWWWFWGRLEILFRKKKV